MKNSVDLSINPKSEVQKITKFLKDTLSQKGFQKVIIGISGGVDSTASLFLLKRTLSVKNIIAVHLPYFTNDATDVKKIAKAANIPTENLLILSIKKSVDDLTTTLDIHGKTNLDTIRIGNIMARVRMIMLYDIARKHNALVCGTENKSEFFLGYFTRFGDEASDIEPIRHLYKTQVYELAKYLQVPKFVIQQEPTAGLWHGQTDEGEFGFSYKVADTILYLHFDKKLSRKEIIKRGYKNVGKILDWSARNEYKHRVPYSI